jgi:hypothetical protein
MITDPGIQAISKRWQPYLSQMLWHLQKGGDLGAGTVAACKKNG